jgi:hypothetical protein
MKIEENAYEATQIFFTISKFFVMLIVFAFAGFIFTHPSMQKNIELEKEKKEKSLELLKIKKQLKKVEVEVNQKKAFIKKNVFDTKLYKKDRESFLKMFNIFTNDVKLNFKEIKLSEKFYNRAVVKLNVIYANRNNLMVEQMTAKIVAGMLKVPSANMYPLKKTIKFEGKNQEILSFEVYSRIKQ